MKHSFVSLLFLNIFTLFSMLALQPRTYAQGQDMQKTILVTGGAGYIGSHTARMLAQKGYHVLIVDKLIHNQPFDHAWATLIADDFANQELLNRLFTQHKIDAVMHFAAYIEVGESVKNPLKFYDNNVSKTLVLLDAMKRYGINNFIFSSSCAVCGIPHHLPLTESHPKNPISPYGASKLMVEMILHDMHIAHDLRYVNLRYFNAAGCLPEEGLGEFHEPETHLIPLLLRAALNNKPFKLFGTQHPTPDGSCIRDFLHVWDIAHAHVKALQYLEQGGMPDSFNLGTGTGTSVKEMIAAVEHLTNKKVLVEELPARAGDPAILVADAQKAKRVLGWQPTHYSEIAYILKTALKFELQH